MTRTAKSIRTLRCRVNSVKGLFDKNDVKKIKDFEVVAVLRDSKNKKLSKF